MDDLDQHDGAGDPARAFEDLRAEVSVLRRAVEALPPAWTENRPPDYSPDLGRIGKTLGAVVAHLQTIENHPALMMTPAEHQQSIMRAGEQVLHSPAQELNRATHSLDRERQQLADLIGVVRTKPQQFRALAVAAGIALAAGLVLSPILAGSLPFGLNSRIAALVMRQDRWNAGGALMQAQSPDGWRALLAADLLVRVNQEALATCRAAAAKGGLGRRCTIEVSAE